jgi:hypothetical protein
MYLTDMSSGFIEKRLQGTDIHIVQHIPSNILNFDSSDSQAGNLIFLLCKLLNEIATMLL